MLISLQKVPRTAMARKDCLLPARARYVLGYLVYGIDEPVDGKPHIPVGKPLSGHQIAELLGVRQRYVYSLLADATFKTEFAAALAQKRQGYAAKAIDRIGEIIDSPNETAALNAAKAILGEDAKAPSVNVSVATQTNLAQDIRPGYIVRLPPELERKRSETEQKP
jgi:hypothetical protein